MRNTKWFMAMMFCAGAWLIVAGCNEASRNKSGLQNSAPSVSSNGRPKPEALLRQMADYYANLPAFSCKINVGIHLQAPGRDHQMDTKLTARLERPNRIALVVDEGQLGMTLISDGKQLWQYLPMLNRYTVREAPQDLSEVVAGEGASLLATVGGSGALIPTDGEKFYQKLMEGVKRAEYLGEEKVGEVKCHRCRFVRDDFTWDIWIEVGERPLVHQIVPDLSRQFAKAGAAFKDAKLEYTVEFTDWNVTPKFTEEDFAFHPPAGAEQVDSLFAGLRGRDEEPGPHPLLGQGAPAFETVDPNGQPIDLNQYLGKNIIMLDFWATWCGPCVAAMPELEAVAKKFADRGLVFYAVNAGEDADTVKQFLAENQREAPVAMDPEGKVSGLYGVEGIPQTVLVGKDGRVQVVHVGYSDRLAGELTRNIEDLLAGKDLAEPVLAQAEKNRQRRSSASAAEESARPAGTDDAQ